MKIKSQFGIRFLLLLIFVAALCVFAWQSIPKRGKPILNGQIVDSHGAPIPNVEITLYQDLLVRIGVSHPEFGSVDGAVFWDVTVPYVENRKYEWNLVLTRIPSENAK